MAVVVIGPERLPHYAEQLGRWVRQLRVFMQDARRKVDEELGVDSADVDWQALDPRRYDPRRIVRDALLDDLNDLGATLRPTPGGRTYTSGAAGVADGVVAAAVGDVADGSLPAPTSPTVPARVPFDDEAT
ncbi:MAG TPA: Sec-independent protein translocase TatB [Cellulomonadaceae bacterium]|nr:Sec-independent protein translocase TatB [Cellulomonadaceae bacterium]